MSTRRLVHKSFQYLPEIGLAGSKEIPNMTYPTCVMLVGCKSRKTCCLSYIDIDLKMKSPPHTSISFCWVKPLHLLWCNSIALQKKRIRVHPLPSLPSQEVANKSKALLICFPWQTNWVIPVSSHSMKFRQYHKNATKIRKIHENHRGTYTD